MNIQRLTTPLRLMTRLDVSDAKAMHVVSDMTGNLPVVNPTRYNVRLKNGVIAKYTLTDCLIDIVYMVKHGNKYVSSDGRRMLF